MSSLYPERISLTIIEDCVLEAHRQYVEQVITNILSNALKYSKDTVFVELKNQSLILRDTGPGIPEKVLARIGEPFNASATGTGLGLAWVKTLCDRNSWSFKLDSNASGTTITLIFKNEKVI